MTTLNATSSTGAIAAPKVTMPPEVEAEVRRAYEQADVILEYGSGGSTVLASQMAGKTIFSVECDLKWAAMMVEFFQQTPSESDVNVHFVDVGETKAWAYPKSRASVAQWHDYPTSIWRSEEFVQPDVVLIDGRFRAACFLTVMLFTKTPVTVIVDDYIDRPKYKVIEEFAQPIRLVERAAIFDVKPTIPTPEMMTALMAASVQTM